MFPQKPQQSGSGRPQPHTLRTAGLVAIVAMACAVGWGVFSRDKAFAELRERADAEAILTVSTVTPKQGPKSEKLVLPGTVQANLEAPIYARTSGYIKSWQTDIGSQVKKGQKLAEIDTPEVDDQWRQAQADLATAEANDAIARSTAKRWQALLATDSVSKQETDEKLADAAAKDAQVASAKANLSRLLQLQQFKQVVAPFDGVVTARQTDVGNLINAGSGSGTELFRVADTKSLRIYVQVPQAYSPSMAVGMQAELHFNEHPGHVYPASVVRTAQALDPASRTLLVELKVDNANGELLPGGYTDVQFQLSSDEATLRLPVNTLLFRSEGLRVAEVDADGKVTLLPITLGRDFGTQVEVVSGLEPNQVIVLNPPDSLVDGQQVHLAATGRDK